MPFDFTLSYRPLPPLRAHVASGLPLWRRLHAVADAALTRFTSFWSGLFADVRAELNPEVLAHALDDSILFSGEHVVLAAWEQAAEVPARQLLPLLVQDVVEDAALVATPSATASVSITLTFQPGLPEVQQAIDAYVGTQIRDISTTTLRTLRQVLRAGWNANMPVQALARELRTVIGLTPRQQRTVARAQARLEDEGKTARQVQRAVEQMTQVALRQRALQISRTETMASANMGAFLALDQSIRSGFLDAEQVRRYWVTAGETACPTICGPIPGMNPSGVRYDTPFSTPVGPLLYPVAHPSCRCVVDVHPG